MNIGKEVDNNLEMGKKLKEEGNLKKKTLTRSFRKVGTEKIKLFSARSDAYLYEATAEIGCCETTITNICRKLKITRKKNAHYKEQKAEQVTEYQKIIKDIQKINEFMWMKLFLTVIYSVHMLVQPKEREFMKGLSDENINEQVRKL